MVSFISWCNITLAYGLYAIIVTGMIAPLAPFVFNPWLSLGTVLVCAGTRLTAQLNTISWWKNLSFRLLCSTFKGFGCLLLPWSSVSLITVIPGLLSSNLHYCTMLAKCINKCSAFSIVLHLHWTGCRNYMELLASIFSDSFSLCLSFFQLVGLYGLLFWLHAVQSHILYCTVCTYVHTHKILACMHKCPWKSD